MLKFSKRRSNFKVKWIQILVLIERAYRKEYTYEIPITYDSKDISNVKVFADKQTD
jgi:hypothetical protein